MIYDIQKMKDLGFNMDPEAYQDRTAEMVLSVVTGLAMAGMVRIW